jgi:hypothetical protein
LHELFLHCIANGVGPEAIDVTVVLSYCAWANNPNKQLEAGFPLYTWSHREETTSDNQGLPVKRLGGR